MKKFSILSALVLGLAAFTSCESDRDDNPKVHIPTSAEIQQTFVLNTPSVGAQTVDLKNSSYVEVVARTQPDYGFPAEVNYGAEMSFDAAFPEAQTYTLPQNDNSNVFRVSTSELDKGIMVLKGIESEDGYSAQLSEAERTQGMPLYLRLTAMLTNDPDSSTFVTSANYVTLNVLPYFTEVGNMEPQFWYLIGEPIGDGKWTNYFSGFPVGLIDGNEYSKATGTGVFGTTVYLPKDKGFKIVLEPGTWDDNEWGYKSGNWYKKTGGAGGDNVTVSEDGFYNIQLDTKEQKVSMTKVDAPANTYSSITLIGTFNGWADDGEIEMTPANGAGDNNHMWTASFKVEKTEQFKFRADHAWGTNWGYGQEDGDVNAYGLGTNGGKNIGIEKGEYVVYLNDIDGFFLIVKQ